MTNVQRCTDRVPETLCVDLSRSVQCSLMGTSDGYRHSGDHRATVVIPKVGRVTYRWKRGASMGKQPPVIDLPTPLASIKRS